ncbi:hypothetical protein MRX96_049662 [Rhipicephalus microplus]
MSADHVPDYDGIANPEMNRDYTAVEIIAAIDMMHRVLTPGLKGLQKQYLMLFYTWDTMVLSDLIQQVGVKPNCSLWAKKDYKTDVEVTTKAYFLSICDNPQGPELTIVVVVRSLLDGGWRRFLCSIGTGEVLLGFEAPVTGGGARCIARWLLRGWLFLLLGSGLVSGR